MSAASMSAVGSKMCPIFFLKNDPEAWKLPYTQDNRPMMLESLPVPVGNARDAFPELSQFRQLQKHGFTKVDFKPAMAGELEKVENTAAYQLGGQQENELSKRIRMDYFAEIEKVVQEVTGAKTSKVFNYLVRPGAPEKRPEGKRYVTKYAAFAHCDFTDEYITNLKATQGTFAFFNVWQPINNVVLQNPLCLLDFESLDPEDAVPVELGYSEEPHSKRLNIVMLNSKNKDKQKWYMFEKMRPDEFLLFTQLDTRQGHAKRCFHTSTLDPEFPVQVPTPRRSIETRVLCTFEDENSTSKL